MSITDKLQEAYRKYGEMHYAALAAELTWIGVKTQLREAHIAWWHEDGQYAKEELNKAIIDLDTEAKKTYFKALQANDLAEQALVELETLKGMPPRNPYSADRTFFGSRIEA